MSTLGGKIKSVHINDGPLSSTQLNQKRELVAKYRSFWDKAKYNKGWSKPLFERHEVDDLLDEAAEIVVRIRNGLGSKYTKCRNLLPSHGSAHEYLWNLETNPLDDKPAFVRDIVHATFSNTAGYLNSLSLQAIDDAILQVRNIRSRLQLERQQRIEKTRESLIEQWKSATTTFEELFPGFTDLVLQQEESDLKKRQLASEERHIHKLIESLSAINVQIQAFKNARQAFLKKQEEKASEPAVGPSSEAMNDDEPAFAPSEPKESPQEPAAPAEPKEESKPEESSSSEGEEKPKGRDALRHSSACLLRVKTVADGVENISGKIKELSDQVKAFKESSSSSDDEDSYDPEKELKFIQRLQRQTAGYSDGLMRSLLELDSIVGSESARPKRREQVIRIQNLLKDVEEISQNLHDLHASLKKEVDEHKAQAAAAASSSPSSSSSSSESAPAPEPASAPAPETQPEKKEEPKEDESKAVSVGVISPEERAKQQKEQLNQLWRKLKLDPQFEVRNHRDAYFVVAMIPGMKQEDIEVSIDTKKNTVTIKGFRGPSDKELQIMRRQLYEIDRRNIFGRAYPKQENELLRLLRLGSGRFGSFSETYNIPKDAIVEKIAASYEEGQLALTIPRIPRVPVAQHPRRSAFNPFFPPQARDRPYGFFDDEDLFW